MKFIWKLILLSFFSLIPLLNLNEINVINNSDDVKPAWEILLTSLVMGGILSIIIDDPKHEELKID